MQQQKISQEQVRLLYAQPSGTFFGSIVVALAASYTLWTDASHPGWIILWCGATIALVIGRLYAHRVYARHLAGNPAINERLWGVFYCLCSFATGTLWGLSLVLFFPQDRYDLAIIMVIHAGYISAAVLATSIYFPAFLSFIGSSSVLITAAILIHGGGQFTLMASLSAFYSGMLVYFGVRNNRSVTEQIELRIENTELLRQVAEQRDRAHQAMLDKNRFLASASHDLRQPVHALGLQVGNMGRHVQSDEARAILKSIRKSTEGLSDLFHGLLDLSELDANAIQNSPGHHRLGELLTRIDTDFQSIAQDKGLSLNIDTNTDAIALVDRGLLERVLRNLLSNAIKYTQRGGVTLSVSEAASDDKIHLAVIDTGQGIPADEIDNIFSEYHQIENPERDRRKGLGLGLAIVRRICALTDTPIRVDSAPGVGSTFTIELVAGNAIQLAHRQPPPAPQDIADAIILIIENELPILEAMTQMLEDWGCEVISATHTDEALAKLQDQRFLDAIVADLRLPNDDSGLQSVARVRARYDDGALPALLLTGDTDPERLESARRAGVRMIHKPIEPAELKREITRLLYPPEADH